MRGLPNFAVMRYYPTCLPLSSILGVVILLLCSCNPSYPNKKFGKGELLYTSDIPETDVDKVGNFLLEMGYFGDKGKNTIKLQKNTDTFLIQLVVDKAYHFDTSYDEQFRSLGSLASLSVLKDNLVMVELLDRNLNIKRRVRP
jgi:hypothetical protein